MRQVLHAHGLAYGMHRQLRTSHIYRPNASIRAEDRPDGAAATAIVPDHEFLHRRQISPARELPNDYTRDCARGISLIGIALYHHPPVHLRSVALLVLGGVIGMDGVGHVDAQAEATPDRAIVQGRAHAHVYAVTGTPAVARHQSVTYTPHRIADDGTTGSRDRLAPDFRRSK